MISTETPAWKNIQVAFASDGLRHVFVELLGWSSSNGGVPPIEIDGKASTPEVVAELKGYKVFLIESESLPSPKIQSQLDTELAVRAPERITIFSDGRMHHWRWPHQTPSGGVSFETVTVSASSMPSFLAQRLVGLRFVANDFARGLTLVDVRDRVRGKFDGAKVTKKFFEEFRQRHQSLADSIEGLDLETDRSAYATLLMNRLMLLYFLQKREFLNDDPFYLESCLSEVQKIKGSNQFYGFYRDLLLPMFFDRLAAYSPAGLDLQISQVIGDIPYINGGIYEPSPVEREFGESLNVPDAVFEEILGFFGRFNWHLDTRPSGLENEINPEVIGYIFEQYINYTAGGKKDNGAYYTKEDVTGYMVGATLVPRIIDSCVALGIPYRDLVADDPLKYLQHDMLHGFTLETKSWAEAPKELFDVWEKDPIHWSALDHAQADPSICLPGETWVETFYRRERVDKLIGELSEGLIGEVNDLVTHNLNARLVLTDAIDRIENSETVVSLWRDVTSLTVLDPTCGSGAFLFAAMESLEDVYHHVISVMKSTPEISPEAVKIIEEINRHPNERYFVRKSIALNNLYGTDVMPDAIETAQLRIFLALVSCLETKSDLEPLPDLDFNLKCGNLLLGFHEIDDLDDIERFDKDLLASLALKELRPRIEEYKSAYSAFVELSASGDSESVAKIKLELAGLSEHLREQANNSFSDLSGIAMEDRESWVASTRPFHWFIEFPDVIDRGGFDVIVGNPPYVAKRHFSEEEKRQTAPYKTSSCPDLYAVCYERSLDILSPGSGRHALIVMLSLVFSDRYSTLRSVISDQNRSEWWSTYGNFPDGLFSGAAVRNTILVLGPGSKVHSARHHIFSVETRPQLFTALEFHPDVRVNDASPARGGLVGGLESILRDQSPGGEQSGVARIYLKPTATYWFPVLPKVMPSFAVEGEIDQHEDSSLKPVVLQVRENHQQVVAVLGGKIGYFWWSATGDNFHVAQEQTIAPRALLLELSKKSNNLSDLAQQVFLSIPSAAILVNHKGVRANIRWSDLSAVTDLFDKHVLDLAGLGSQWRSLNIWYRQSMRSSGASKKDKPMDAKLAKSLVQLN